MDQNELNQQQNIMLENIEEVKQRLLQLPNVIAVGIGIKESNNEFTGEISYRVFVDEKKPVTALAPMEVVPAEISGIKTDVLQPYSYSMRPGVCGTERRTLSKHRPLKAGIAVSDNSTSYGTLGWFGKLADNSTVILSNEHVLGHVADVKAAQPKLSKVSKCCCCECGSDDSVGKVLFGLKNAVVDCAIAKLDSEFAGTVRLEINNDATTEVMTVANPATAAAVVGANVRKIGARSGFTRGVVIHIGDTAVAGNDPAGNAVAILPDQVLIIPAATETYQVSDMSTGTSVCKFAFSNNGDSGSVILNDDNRIVALLHGGTEKTNSVDITFANNIANVLAALTTGTFPVTLSSSGGGRSDTTATREVSAPQPAGSNILEKLKVANEQSLLYHLYEKHHEEIFDLINERRAVTVAWQRNQGPAYVAAIARAAREPAYKLPFSINGVSRETLLSNMGTVLSTNGTDALVSDINRFREEMIRLVNDGEDIEDLAERFREAGLIDVLPINLTPKAV